MGYKMGAALCNDCYKTYNCKLDSYGDFLTSEDEKCPRCGSTNTVVTANMGDGGSWNGKY